jgi:hypothetical protein
MKRDISKIKDDNRFLVEAGEILKRQADYKTMEKIQKAFVCASSTQAHSYSERKSKSPFGAGMCGNVDGNFRVNKVTKKISITKEWSYPLHSKFCSLSCAISSSLALYRLICMFPDPIVTACGSSGYKVPWSFYIKHKKTGHIICMSEWKGSFGFRTIFSDFKEMPKDLVKDIKMLLDLMLSNNSPHPYDSTVAGSCA